jgi:hypothetical protein
MRAIVLASALLISAVYPDPTPANYAIDGNGQLIDLDGYSRYSNEKRPFKIELSEPPEQDSDSEPDDKEHDDCSESQTNP